MTPHKHTLCNDVLKAPIGDENCDDLHIMRDDQSVWSFWKPNAEELAAIVQGGSVALRVCGRTHPPLSIHATTPENEGAKAITEAEGQVIDRAIREQFDRLMKITKSAFSTWTRQGTDTPERRKLVDQFLDLVTINRGAGEVIRSVPVDEPEAPTITQTDLDRYRADAEAWKAEAERAKAEIREQWPAMVIDRDTWKAKAEESEAKRLALQAAIDSVIDQLNRVSVQTPTQ
jgi:hypothetical protein